MPDHWRVLKFGGTSVADPGHWETIAGLAAERRSRGDRVLLVCSALAGVTDQLDSLADDPEAPVGRIDELLERHRRLANGLGIESKELIRQAGEGLASRVERLAKNPGPECRAALLAWGEWVSSQIGALFLSGRMDAAWADASGSLVPLPEEEPDGSRAWLSARCAAGTDKALADRLSSLPPVLVTQGYVARRKDGRAVLLGRGGSDTSAALLAGRLGAPEVEIWTDVPGLFSADPAMEPGAVLLRELDYAEALEMAASGARVVHPRCIRAAADCGLAISIRDLGRPGLEGTRISGSHSAVSEKPPATGIKAVTCQAGMLVMLLENLDTRQQVGFLAWVFSVFSRHGVSIDLVATSETTTTVAINGVDNHLDDSLIASLSEELSVRCSLRVYRDCSCVNLVGRGARLALSQMSPALRSFREWPLLMLSQSANDMCLSLLVYPDHAKSLVHELHGCLLEGLENAESANLYGAAWQDLVSA